MIHDIENEVLSCLPRRNGALGLCSRLRLGLLRGSRICLAHSSAAERRHQYQRAEDSVLHQLTF
jgi:hypothetical protein